MRTTSRVSAERGSSNSGAHDSQVWCGFGSTGNPRNGDHCRSSALLFCPASLDAEGGVQAAHSQTLTGKKGRMFVQLPARLAGSNSKAARCRT
jgi:hypothetical protein